MYATTTSTVIQELLAMLAYRRPHRSESEQQFIEQFIDVLPGVTADDFGNRIVPVGSPPYTTLFSCHTDTVHRAAGTTLVDYQPDFGIVRSADDREPLGADDGTGVWLLCNMIRANVPGLYIFHRGEERGGLGSRHIQHNTPELLTGVQRAIAFDRRGTNDVITHQGFARCCSDTFGKALAEALNSHTLYYRPSDRGVFTDTANYIDLIPECTNLSVGYENEHSANEYQDLEHAEKLLYALLKVDWNALPTERDPTKVDEFDIDDWRNRTAGNSYRFDEEDYLYSTDAPPELLETLVYSYPEYAIELMQDMRISYGDVYDVLPADFLEQAPRYKM